jgi:uncharacterized protein
MMFAQNPSANPPLIREEHSIPEGKSVALAFNWNGATVPGILLIPHRTEQKTPVALLLHGFGVSKESMARSVGIELLLVGIASLAIDLPFHGERYEGIFVPPINPFELMSRWDSVVRECLLALDFLAGHPELDRDRLSLMGYSFGSFLGLKVASSDPRVRAVVLAASGDFPDYIPFAPLIRSVADPLQWVRQLKMRPLLMLHGRRDSIVPPELAERLFDAAGEPKEMVWFNSDHILPREAMAQAARWLRHQMVSGQEGTQFSDRE